jgi:asparagine synthase (glutamine-hydrolysing)
VFIVFFDTAGRYVGHTKGTTVCGIAGLIDISLSEIALRELLSQMISTLVHRGPDSSGCFVHQCIGMAMRRLKIIDLETGDQPISNENGRIWVILNGEIYNYLELKVILETKGHQFYTHSDTEVIAHLYEEHGEACFEHLRGMFAIAIIDTLQNRLILARDRFGMKPLFVSDTGCRFAFASEIRALKTLPWHSDQLDYQALDAFLNLGYIPSGMSAYSGIHKMQPGTYEVWSTESGRPALQFSGGFHTPVTKKTQHIRSFEEAAEVLAVQLRDSLKMHMRSDVPVGVFLSGGIDSSVIVALLAEMGFSNLTTLSIGFDSASFDELEYARLVSSTFGTRHIEKRLSIRDCLKVAETAVDLFDEPFADSSSIPTLELCRLARQEVTVALSGEGGDEVFAGYGWYRSMDYWERIDRIPRFLRASVGSLGSLVIPEGSWGAGFVRRLGSPAEQRYLSLVSTPIKGLLADCLSSGFLDRLTSIRKNEAWKPRFVAVSPESSHLIDQANYLPDDLLVKADRCSMAVSLETRLPFLDHVLGSFVASLPCSYLRKRSGTKLILREVVKNLLPSRVLEHPKQGFAIPMKQWLSQGLGDLVSETFESAAETGYFNAAGCKRLLNASVRSRKGLEAQLWRMYCLARWITKVVPR